MRHPQNNGGYGAIHRLDKLAVGAGNTEGTQRKRRGIPFEVAGAVTPEKRWHDLFIIVILLEQPLCRFAIMMWLFNSYLVESVYLEFHASVITARPTAPVFTLCLYHCIWPTREDVFNYHHCIVLG